MHVTIKLNVCIANVTLYTTIITVMGGTINMTGTSTSHFNIIF